MAEPRPADQGVPERIWLIGLMGSGKSTVGRALAAQLGHEYIDNDQTIATLAGRSTVDLARAGNGLLHQWESRYVHYLASLAGPVVAGIPASIADRAPDLRLLSGSGLLVYLRCDLDTLTARIQADEPRPWIDGDPHALLASMLAQRDPALEGAAHLTVDATEPVPKITARIAQGAHETRSQRPAR